MTYETRKTMDIKIELSAKEIAQAFWSLPSDEQVMFFNELADVSQHLLPMQLQYVTDDEALTAEGRMAMKYIGDYSEPSQ